MLTLRRLLTAGLPPQGRQPAPQDIAYSAQQRMQGLPPDCAQAEDMVAAMRFMRVFRTAIGMMPRRSVHHVEIDNM